MSTADAEGRDGAADASVLEKHGPELFFHTQGAKPRIAYGVPSETLREVMVRYEMIGATDDQIFVFVGECEEALREPLEVEDGVDEHAAVDIDLTLEVLEIHRHRHVHHHHCRHIAIEVNFDGKTKRHRFSPNTAVGVATDWARRKFRLDPAIAPEYVLQLCGSPVQPRSDEHLGEVVQGETCSICFDLVKELTPKG